MSVMQSNCTSFRTQHEGVIAVDADVKVLSETRLSSAGQVEWDNKLRTTPWKAVWGAPVKRKRFDKRLPPRGVAVLVRKEMQIRQIMPNTPQRRDLWEQGRLMHCVLHTEAGAVHIFALYGFTNSCSDREQRQKNEELLRETFHWAAELGNVRILIGGDLNTTVEASTILSCALASGRYEDFAQLQAMALGQERPEPTCFQQGSSVGSRIDYIIANNILAPSFQGLKRLDDTGIPTHRPLLCELDVAVCKQDGVRYRLPRELPMDWGLCEEEKERDKAAEEACPILEESQYLWDLALEHGDVDTALEVISTDAERYFFQRSTGRRLVSAAWGGEGAWPDWRRGKQC